MRFLILTYCFFYSLPVFSAPTDCKAIIKTQYPKTFIDDRDSCYCGSQLENLTVTLPSDLRVIAVCGLRVDNANGSDLIDLNKEKLSLDTYRNGYYPNGHVFLSGEIKEQITGKVMVDEGPAGRLWFNASIGDRRGPVFWINHLASLSLGSSQDYQKLRATKLKTDKGQCWEAEATLKMRNHRVSLGQTDEAGTTADFEVIRIAEYKPCQKRDPGDSPASRLSQGQPKDVAELIHRIFGCHYYQGDWPYAEEYEKAQYAAEIVKLNCAALPKDEESVRASHVNDEVVGQRINAAKSFKY